MNPYLLFLYLYLLTPAKHSPIYESPAAVFARVEKQSVVAPWSEPPILPGNSMVDRMKEHQ